MDSDGRNILLGVVLGVVFVLAVTALGINWGTERVKTAGMPIEPPILFQPK